MSEIVINLPDELVERARAEGLTLDAPRLIAMVEMELARLQAARSLSETAQRLRGSMTLEEVEAELAAAKAERIARNQRDASSP